MKKLKRKFIKAILLLAFLSSCTSIRQAQQSRNNRHINTYKDAHGKWHTVIGFFIVGMLLFSCKAYKIDKSTGKNEPTWNTRHLQKIHGDSTWVKFKMFSIK